MKTILSGIVASAILLCAVSAHAATWKFDVLLDGLQETPPNASPGTGEATALLDDSTGVLDVSGVFRDLIGTSTVAHIHGYADLGDPPAGVIFGLTVDIGVTMGSYSGSGNVDVAQALAGKSYVNVHSSVFPGGEIRGQLLNPMKVPEPGSLMLAGIGLLSAVAWRRRICR